MVELGCKVVPIPSLNVADSLLGWQQQSKSSSSRLLAHAAAASLAESNVEVPIPRVPPRFDLVSCESDDDVLYCILCFLVLPPLPVPVVAVHLPCRLVAAANALSGLVMVGLLLPPRAPSHFPL